MAKAIRFRVPFPKIKIVNRCITCGKNIKPDRVICPDCYKKYKFRNSNFNL